MALVSESIKQKDKGFCLPRITWHLKSAFLFGTGKENNQRLRGGKEMKPYLTFLLIFLMGCTTPLKKWDKRVEDPHGLMERQKQNLELIQNKDEDYEIREVK